LLDSGNFAVLPAVNPGTWINPCPRGPRFRMCLYFSCDSTNGRRNARQSGFVIPGGRIDFGQQDCAEAPAIRPRCSPHRRRQETRASLLALVAARRSDNDRLDWLVAVCRASTRIDRVPDTRSDLGHALGRISGDGCGDCEHRGIGVLLLSADLQSGGS